MANDTPVAAHPRPTAARRCRTYSTLDPRSEGARSGSVAATHPVTGR